MNEGDGQIAQCRHDLRSRAGTQTGAIFAKGHVAHVMQSVLVARQEGLLPLPAFRTGHESFPHPAPQSDGSCHEYPMHASLHGADRGNADVRRKDYRVHRFSLDYGG